MPTSALTATGDWPLLIQPGWQDSGPEHWQSHWQQRLGARRVHNRDWHAPQLEEWLAGLHAGLEACGRPAVVIAHSLGCITVAHYARRHPERIAAALLVAPADVERSAVPAALAGFGPIPRAPLPFPVVVVASSNDPYCLPVRAAALAAAWQAPVEWLSGAGHINAGSGLGGWQEGERYLQRLYEQLQAGPARIAVGE